MRLATVIIKAGESRLAAWVCMFRLRYRQILFSRLQNCVAMIYSQGRAKHERFQRRIDYLLTSCEKKKQTTFITKTWSISCLSIRPLAIEKLQVEGEGKWNRDWVVADSGVTGLVIE